VNHRVRKGVFQFDRGLGVGKEVAKSGKEVRHDLDDRRDLRRLSEGSNRNAKNI